MLRHLKGSQRPALLLLISTSLLVLTAPLSALSDDSSRPKLADRNSSIDILQAGLGAQSLSVKPGTTVVWVNKAQVPVQLRFLSRGISTTCKAPVQFRTEPDGVFESEPIPAGGIASLCFLEPDDYQYQVEYLQGEEKEVSSQPAVEAAPAPDEAAAELTENTEPTTSPTAELSAAPTISPIESVALESLPPEETADAASSPVSEAEEAVHTGVVTVLE